MVLSGVMLTACGISGSPTYGTDKTQSQQLLSDVSNMVTFKSGNNNAIINTKPRPDLVQPAPGSQRTLPKPQENVAQAGSPDWPESPEQRRKRLRDEATANQSNSTYVSPIVSDKTGASNSDSSSWLNGIHRGEAAQGSKKQQRQDYLRRKQENAGGTAETRKYLSEPPLIYREPAKTAPIGEQGEDEAKKEHQRTKSEKKVTGKKSWWPF